MHIDYAAQIVEMIRTGFFPSHVKQLSSFQTKIEAKIMKIITTYQLLHTAWQHA